MKTFKKMMALVIAMVMTLAMVVPAMAEVNTLTITGAKKGHTYTAYQIFTGDVVKGHAAIPAQDAVTDPDTGEVITPAVEAQPATQDQLTNIQWGTGVSAVYKTEKGNAAVLAESLTTEAHAKALAAEIAKGTGYLGSAAGSATALADGNVAISNLPDGYYLIIDTAGSDVAETNDVFSQYIVKLVKSTEVATKLDVPSSEKKVKDNDYTTDDGEQKTGVAVGAGYNDAADYSIGDDVPFELFGTLPSNYAEYTKYKYEFKDTACAGLDIKADTVHVYVDGTEVTTGFTKTVSPDKHTLEIKFADLKTAVPTATSSSKVKVTFDATLNKSAEIGLPGNNNKVELTFSNNPTDGGEGTSKTPEDEVLVFTYELDVSKVDGTDTSLKLTKAQFVLKATSGDHSGEYVLLDADYKVNGWTDTKPTAIAQDDVDLAKVTTDYNQAGILVSAGDGAEFKIIGLDAGDYELEEIQAPAGYNLLDAPIAVKVIATQANTQKYKDEAATDTPAKILTKLEIDVAGTKSDGDTTTGIVSTVVKNNSGTVLPETGGIGTTIFYVVGAILVLGAGIVLVTKRRMSAN